MKLEKNAAFKATSECLESNLRVRLCLIIAELGIAALDDRLSRIILLRMHSVGKYEQIVIRMYFETFGLLFISNYL